MINVLVHIFLNTYQCFYRSENEGLCRLFTQGGLPNCFPKVVPIYTPANSAYMVIQFPMLLPKLGFIYLLTYFLNTIFSIQQFLDMGLIPGLGRFPGEGKDSLEKATHSNKSCLGNPTDRRAWQATIHGVTKGRVRLDLVVVHAHSHL